MVVGSGRLGAVVLLVPRRTGLRRVRQLGLLAVPLGRTGLLLAADRAAGRRLLGLTEAGLAHDLVALFVHQELALDALEALAAQAPDPVLAVRAERSLERREIFRLGCDCVHIVRVLRKCLRGEVQLLCFHQYGE